MEQSITEQSKQQQLDLGIDTNLMPMVILYSTNVKDGTNTILIL
jgi:hypothetical protein